MARPDPARVLPLADNGQDANDLFLVVHLVEHMLPGQTDPAHALAVLWRGLVQPGKFGQFVGAVQHPLTELGGVP